MLGRIYNYFFDYSSTMASDGKTLKLQLRPAFARSLPEQENCALISTYQLQEDTTRKGSLCIVNVAEDGSLELAKEHPTPAGVFRFEFLNPSTTISALTDGSLCINQLSDSWPESTIPVSSETLLDVSTRDSRMAATTDNKGYVYIVDLDTSTIVSSWEAHSLPFVEEPCEIWTCAIGNENQIVATGGEDSTMRLWDVRTHTPIGHCKLFEAGVTFIDWIDENILSTASYDQHIRIIDRRNMKQAEKEVKLEGGVWNIESNSDGSHVAACMYGGYAVLDSQWNVTRQNIDAGKQLLYGATRVGPNKVIYTTFNDYLVAFDSW